MGWKSRSCPHVLSGPASLSPSKLIFTVVEELSLTFGVYELRVGAWLVAGATGQPTHR